MGISRDILPGNCLFSTPAAAADLLAAHARSGSLTEPTAFARQMVLAENNSAALRASLLAAYENLPDGGVPLTALAQSAAALAFISLRTRLGVSPGEFPPHPRAALTEAMMGDLPKFPAGDGRLVTTPLDPSDQQSRESLLAAAAMCRDANLDS